MEAQTNARHLVTTSIQLQLVGMGSATRVRHYTNGRNAVCAANESHLAVTTAYFNSFSWHARDATANAGEDLSQADCNGSKGMRRVARALLRRVASPAIAACMQYDSSFTPLAPKP